MIRVGIFYDYLTAKYYNVYELSSKKYLRLDIVNYEDKDAFLVSNRILFSIVKKSKTYTIGDEELYKRFNSCYDSALTINMKIETTPDRKPGQIIMNQSKIKSEKDYYEVQLVNGRKEKERFGFNGSYGTMMILQIDSVDTLDPPNMREYKTKEISKVHVEAEAEYLSYTQLKQLYDIEHIEACDYKVIPVNPMEIEELKRALLDTKKTGEIIGYDTETDTLEFTMHSKGNVVGLIFSVRKGHSRYIPLGHNKIDNYDISIFNELIQFCIDNDLTLTAHHKKFEQKIFKYYGIDYSIKHDSLVASCLNNPVRIKGAHSLKNLEELRSGKFYLELKQICIGEIRFQDFDIDVTRIYACPDADNTVSVLKSELDYMKRKHPKMMSLYELECELADLKAEQEFYGMRIDEDAAHEGGEYTTACRGLVKELIYATIGEDIDLDSPKAMSNLLYNRMQCKEYVRTKTDAPSTGAAALKKLGSLQLKTPRTNVTKDIRGPNIKKKLPDGSIVEKEGELILKAADLNKAQYPVVLLIQKYREYSKKISGFYNRIEKNKACSRLFFDINQNGTETGRQSSSIHQFAKSLRHIILSDSEDHDFIAADYEQMELRLFFSKAEETELVKLCSVAGVDMHRAIAAAIQGKEIWEISSEERQKDKSRNFGVVYLMSGRGLAASKYGPGATDAQIKECTDSINQFFNRFKRCAELIARTAREGERNRYAETLFGRIRRFEELGDPDISSERKASLIRRLNNMPIQGTGADVMKIAEVEMRRYIKKKGWDRLVETPQGKLPLVRVMVSVHDEALLSKHKSVPLEEVLEMLTICMEVQLEENGIPWAPLFIGTKVGKSWGDGKIDELDIPRELRLKLIEDYKNTNKSCIETDDTMNELLGIIQKFRDTELEQYMEGLIEKAGTEIEGIWKLLRHPQLTHELIARYPQSSESIKLEGILSHHDLMRNAIKQYLDRRSGKVIEISRVKQEIYSEKETEYDIKSIFEEITGLNSDTAYMNSDGTTYFEDNEEEEIDISLFEEDAIEVIRRTVGRRTYIMDFFDSIVVDTDTLLNNQVNVVLQMLHSNRDATAYSSIKLSRAGKIIDTGMKCTELKNKEEIDEYIEKCSVENKSLALGGAGIA